MSHNSSNLISTFQKEIESLKGEVHLASGPEEIANIILGVAANTNCKLAIIESSIGSSNEIQSVLIKHGIETASLADSASTLELLSRADMGITHADLAISQTGTVIIKTTRDEDRLVSCLPRVHIVIISTDKLVDRLTDATVYLKNNLQTHEPCAISFVSGPSRTSDIEMKQILGVHGPHQVHVILYGL